MPATHIVSQNNDEITRRKYIKQKKERRRQRPLLTTTASLPIARLFLFFFFVFSAAVECLAHSKWWSCCSQTDWNWKVAAVALPQDNNHDDDLDSSSSHLVDACSLKSSSSSSIEECLLTRGGDTLSSPSTEEAEKIIKTYLSHQGSTHDGKFLIQGWRWHNLSLVRDTRRLERLANHLLRSSSSSSSSSSFGGDGEEGIGERIDKATYHVIEFNMKDLDNIEKKTFFPWLREKLLNVEDEEVAGAFAAILDGIENDRNLLVKLGKTVREQCKVASSTTTRDPTESITNIAQMSAALTTRARSIFERIERLIVPAVASIVSPKDQKYIDNKILLKLGILQSRVHLVGMYEAIWELELERGKKERELFQEMIPYIPQKMIPRWRRLLYQPQAGVLDI